MIRKANSDPSRDAERAERWDDDRNGRQRRRRELSFIDADTQGDEETERRHEHPEHDAARREQPPKLARIIERRE